RFAAPRCDRVGRLSWHVLDVALERDGRRPGLEYPGEVSGQVDYLGRHDGGHGVAAERVAALRHRPLLGAGVVPATSDHAPERLARVEVGRLARTQHGGGVLASPIAHAMLRSKVGALPRRCALGSVVKARSAWGSAQV